MEYYRERLSGICGLILILLMSASCDEPLTPKPRAYLRIDLPEKQYILFKSKCKFSFQYPRYGQVKLVESNTAEPCWYNIDFNEFNATIYLTYKRLKAGDLSMHIEDIRRIVYKHIIKADDILESRIAIPGSKVYGLIYDIKGNAASSVNFYITDSVSGFLSGSLYFNSVPNKDSLAPAIQFFREDIVHLIQSFSWE